MGGSDKDGDSVKEADKCCGKFCAAHFSLKVSFIVKILSFTLHIVGMSSPLWFEFTYTGSDKKNGYQGLWTHCYWDGSFVCCGTIGDYFNTIGYTTPSWFTAVRVLQGIALLTGLVAIVVNYVCTFKSFTKSTGISAFVFALLSGLLLGTSIVTYAVGIRDSTWTSRFDYHFSFAVSVISAGGFIASAVLLLIGMCTAVCIAVKDIPQ